MKRSLWVSIALHVTVLLVVWLGLPHFLPPLPPPPMIIPIEVADIAEMTNTKTKEQKEAQPPKLETKPPPKPEPPKPLPPESKPPEPTPPKQETPPPPEKKPEPIPEKPPEKKPEPPKKKPEEKPKPKPKPDLLASVLKNVAQIKPKATTPPNPDAKEEEEAQEVTSNAPSLSDRVTISEQDMLRRQIAACWNMPIGARNAEQLVVEVVIEVNADRTVRSAQVVDTARLASDPFFRAAAESAMRALRHPHCTPLDLPPDKYEDWKVIRFTFDPRDML